MSGRVSHHPLAVDQGRAVRGREARLQRDGDLRGVDGVDLVEPDVHQLGVVVEGGELAERVGPGVDPGELVQPVPLELGLGPPQLGLGDPVGDDALDLLQHDVVDPFDGHAVAGPGVGVAHRGAADQPHGARRRGLGQLVAADQSAVEPRRLTVPEHRHAQVDGVEGRGAHRRQPPGEVGGVGRDVGGRLLPGQPAERRQRVGRRERRARTGRQRPEVGLGLAEGGLGLRSHPRSTAPRCSARSGWRRRPPRPRRWPRSGPPWNRSLCARTGGRPGRSARSAAASRRRTARCRTAGASPP